LSYKNFQACACSGLIFRFMSINHCATVAYYNYQSNLNRKRLIYTKFETGIPYYVIQFVWLLEVVLYLTESWLDLVFT